MKKRVSKIVPFDKCASDYTHETMFRILSGIQDQILSADAKVGFIITLNAILFALVGKGLEGKIGPHSDSHLSLFPVALLVTYTFTTVLSIVSAAMAVRSRLEIKTPATRLFFGHIAVEYQSHYERYLDDVCQMNDDQWRKEIANLIVTSSQIALRKHQLIMRSVTFTLVTVILWALVLLTMLVPSVFV